jgi:ER-derived vesicles protein
MLQGEWSVLRFIVSLFGLGACGMVAVGFKARWSATFLVLVLSVFNVFANNWWSMHSHHPQRDFLKYDFFQTLCKLPPFNVSSSTRLLIGLHPSAAIVGGLILLVNMGPGGLSVDEKKKTF